MNNLRLEFNSNIINKIKSYNLTADNLGSILFILFALQEKRYDLLDTLDDSNKERRVLVLYRQLFRRNLLEQDTEDSSYHYKLTDTALKLIEDVRKEFHSQNVEIHAEDLAPVVAPANETKLDTSDIDVESWIEDYVKIFPTGKHNNRILRMHPLDAIKRMEEFVETYGYSKEHIFKATKAYIDNQANSNTGHDFTTNSTYFISKGVGKEKQSLLSVWCKQIEEQKEQIDTSFMDMG